jgi:general secretion pathway protein E
MTTVHANSLFDVLGRFQHFGIDPFGFASALNGIVVQRLLRRTCSHCLRWRAPSESEARTLDAHGIPPDSDIPIASGCEHCRKTGYRGRLVVAEVHELDDAQRDLIVRRASLAELRRHMDPVPAATLLGQGIAAAIAGITTLEEVRRVVG